MKTITAKYIGPTNTKPSRISVTDGDTQRIHSINQSVSFECNCMTYVALFCAELNWHGTLQGGHTKDGMVFTFEDPAYRLEV